MYQQAHPFDDLRRIQRELGRPEVAAELGFEGTWSDIDSWANRVEQGVVVATPETLAAVEERYGDAVVLYPEFRPVED